MIFAKAIVYFFFAAASGMLDDFFLPKMRYSVFRYFYSSRFILLHCYFWSRLHFFHVMKSFMSTYAQLKCVFKPARRV